MRVGVYIDGLNLYYGALKGTNYKWLDIQKFASSLLKPSDNETLSVLKYFTAKTDGQPGVRQQVYLRAIRECCPDLEIIYGYFLRTEADMEPVDRNLGSTVAVTKPEEKGSDVNLAIHMIDDAWREKIDRVLVVTNDGDLGGAIKMVRHRHKNMRIQVGVVPPVSGDRKLSRVLKKDSDFRRNIEANVHLSPCQLPYHIEGTNISKPNRWIPT